MPGNVGLQLLPFLDDDFPDLGGKIPGGQHPEVGLLHRHAKTHQARPGHAGAIGAGFVGCSVVMQAILWL